MLIIIVQAVQKEMMNMSKISRQINNMTKNNLKNSLSRSLLNQSPDLTQVEKT